MAKPTFGIFDHIEDIPGTPTQQLFRDRLELIRLADEAGFESFHLAEHHGSGLCLAPNQELFIAAASQVTTRIRLGPMVKLLPFHHPVRILEDMCVADQLTGGRLDFGVGQRRSPDRARLVRQRLAGAEGALRGHAPDHLPRACHRRDLERGQRLPRLPDRTARDDARPGSDPLLVSGQPGDGGPVRHEPDVARPDRPSRPTTPTSRRGTSTRTTRSGSTGRTPGRGSAAR